MNEYTETLINKEKELTEIQRKLKDNYSDYTGKFFTGKNRNETYQKVIDNIYGAGLNVDSTIEDIRVIRYIYNSKIPGSESTEGEYYNQLVEARENVLNNNNNNNNNVVIGTTGGRRRNKSKRSQRRKSKKNQRGKSKKNQGGKSKKSQRR